MERFSSFAGSSLRALGALLEIGQIIIENEQGFHPRLSALSPDLTMLPDAANVLFHVVNDRHLRKRAMIFTTNKPLSESGRCCTTRTWQPLSWIVPWNADALSTSMDLRGGHAALGEALPGKPERLKISGIGIKGSEFPEPTTPCVEFRLSKRPGITCFQRWRRI
jgi:hypothetical protein